MPKRPHRAAPQRVIAYTRVSSAAQAEEGVSLDAQRQRIAAWCAARGLDMDPADVFTDAGISGKRIENRPQLRAALDAACGCGGILVVYSLSRLARSVRDTIAIADRLERSGADLVSLSEDAINTTTPSGRMLFGLLAVLAQFESDLIGQRTRMAHAHIAGQGRAIGHRPYGLRPGPDGRTLVADPAEAATIAAMQGWKAAGWADRAVARELNRLGVPSKTGGRWSHQSVRAVLDNPRWDDPGPVNRAS